MPGTKRTASEWGATTTLPSRPRSTYEATDPARSDDTSMDLAGKRGQRLGDRAPHGECPWQILGWGDLPVLDRNRESPWPPPPPLPFFLLPPPPTAAPFICTGATCIHRKRPAARLDVVEKGANLHGVRCGGGDAGGEREGCEGAVAGGGKEDVALGSILAMNAPDTRSTGAPIQRRRTTSF
ncbi:hypothetical protein PR202_ga27726 [Eleusine coracana subsp. coracana]|uniref:Uncharacterized protein n=1 Tax=Eleusine coracana subsp. coracana TaxID=191504 RepID=A0AAV5DHP7_ELECO|nr:hypothetical protein PR202_ga27726 [Eleusine coracana subsp. coracana]